MTLHVREPVQHALSFRSTTPKLLQPAHGESERAHMPADSHSSTAESARRNAQPTTYRHEGGDSATSRVHHKRSASTSMATFASRAGSLLLGALLLSSPKAALAVRPLAARDLRGYRGQGRVDALVSGAPGHTAQTAVVETRQERLGRQYRRSRFTQAHVSKAVEFTDADKVLKHIDDFDYAGHLEEMRFNAMQRR